MQSDFGTNGFASRQEEHTSQKVAVAQGFDDPGEVIRVALAELPATLQKSLEQEVKQRGDMRVVRIEAGPILQRVDLLLAVAQGVDVLVLGSPDAQATPGICDHLFSEFPALMVLLVSHSGDLAILHWQGPRRYRVRRVSAESLLRITRRAQAARTSSGAVVRPDR